MIPVVAVPLHASESSPTLAARDALLDIPSPEPVPAIDMVAGSRLVIIGEAISRLYVLALLIMLAGSAISVLDTIVIRHSHPA